MRPYIDFISASALVFLSSYTVSNVPLPHNFAKPSSPYPPPQQTHPTQTTKMPLLAIPTTASASSTPHTTYSGPISFRLRSATRRAPYPFEAVPPSTMLPATTQALPQATMLPAATKTLPPPTMPPPTRQRDEGKGED
jgi:hypothetical protein